MVNRTEKVKISVIVPIYNEINYLDDCISSICNQTYKNLEIILVDDGSSSPCYELCDSYIKKDDRIKVIHKENGGLLSARRVGIEAATGDYISTIDADDWIELDFYKKMTEAIGNKSPDIIATSNYYRNYPDGHFIQVFDNKRNGFWEKDEFEEAVWPYFVRTDDFYDSELLLCMVYYLFKTDDARINMQRMDRRLKYSTDYAFIMLSLLSADSLAIIPYRGYHYRYNTNSMLHNTRHAKEYIQMIYKVVDKAINESPCNKDNLRKKNNWVMFHGLMVADYKEILNISDEFLFPYSKVKKGSRIIIYGMGKIGRQIYDEVKNGKDYEIVGAIDENWKLYREQGYDVAAPENIPSLTYDYIIIAISFANVKNNVKDKLIKNGIEPDKIAEVDLSVLDEAHLPF